LQKQDWPPIIMSVDETRQDVVIKATRAQWLPIGICLIASAGCVVLVLYGISHNGTDEIVALVAGLLAALLIVPATVYLIYRAVRDRPALIIGESGFTDQASLTGLGYVTWDEVAAIRLDRVWLAVKLRDPGPIMARQPAWRRALMRMNSRTVAGDMIIPTNALSVPPQELIKLMIDRLRHGTGMGPD
jgi:hypothetical protein